MSELLQQFHFLRPGWLLALLALPVLWLLATRRSPAQAQLARLVDAALLPHVVQGRERRRFLSAWVLAAGWALATLAMAGPTWSRVAQPMYAQRAAQVVALSLSRHMLARDVAPVRMDRARYKARDLLAANHDGLNGLIAYAGDAFVVAPLTSDASSLNDLLDALAPDTMPVDGDNAAQAIERGVALIHDAKVGGGSLVLVTDGADDEAVAAARKARTAGVRVSVLGVGTAQGGPVPLSDEGFQRDARGGLAMARRDDAALRSLAEAGGGRFVAMTDDRGDIDALRGELQTDGEAALASGRQGDEWQDRGPWLLLPLLPLAALSFRRGWLLLAALALLPALPGTARADGWSSLWRRPDQQAADALQRGQARQAQQLARDPSLRGAAAYRAGDYATATQAWHGLPGSDAQYNLGNALARQGNYQGAIEAYDRALKADPANADAKANRQAVEDWLRRQPTPPPQRQGAQDDKDKPGQGKPTTPPDDAQGQSAKHDASEQGDGQGKPSPDAQGDAKGTDSDKDARQPKPAQDDKAGDKSAAPAQTPEQQARQREREDQARQALQRQMDQALGRSQPHPPSSHELGAMSPDDAQSKLPADVRQALQRVPDDPGALLRRKFDLEYRQRHGTPPPEDDSP